MKPRYYKHWWSKKAFDWYKITEDGKVYSRHYNTNTKKWTKWKLVKDGHFARLMDKQIQEISEEDYFLEHL